MNLVELFADDEDIHFDQPCKFGERIDGHAVYCTNDKMDIRKCRRSWFTGGDVRDEDCEGFVKNEN